MYMGTCVQMCVWARVRKCVCGHACHGHACANVCVHACANVCMGTRVQMCVWACVCKYVHTEARGVNGSPVIFEL